MLPSKITIEKMEKMVYAAGKIRDKYKIN